MTFLFTISLLAKERPAQTNTDAADQLGWQLAVHAYTFKVFPIADAIQMTAGLGLKYMSLSGSVNLDGKTSVATVNLSDEQLTNILQQVTAAGLKLVNVGVVSLTTNEPQDRKVFEFAKKAGIDLLVAEPDESCLTLVDKLCQQYNIKVAIHDHPRPSHYWNPDTVLAALKGRSPMIGACADVGHWKRSGLDPVECLKKLEGHVMVLHFKDLVPDPAQLKADASGIVKTNGARQMHDVPWGTGDSHVKEMMAELQRQKFHGAFCFEYEYHWSNSLPEIAQSVKFFNRTAEELVKKEK